jgi:hypothetical protein
MILQFLINKRPILLAVTACLPLFFGSWENAAAAEAEPKPGETIGPQNWQKVQGMIGEN